MFAWEKGLTLRLEGAEREKKTEGKGAGRPLVHRGKSERNLMKPCSEVDSDWLTFGARCGSGWGPSAGERSRKRARGRPRDRVQGRSLYSTVARQNSVEFQQVQTNLFRSLGIDCGGGRGGAQWS